MTAILNATITTAQSGALGSTFQLRPGPGGQLMPDNVVLQANFTYGSGGTSATAYVQTSLDGGTTWVDVACFAFTTSSARSVANLSSTTPVTTLYTPTDATLTNNTCKDGIVGNLWRVKYTTVGTYASTTLRVDMISNGLTTQS